jgi:tellurite resistance protein TerC
MAAATEIPTWIWLAFAGLIVLLLSIDLAAHRGNRVDSRRRALLWSLAWIAIALLFGAGVWWWLGNRAAEEFLGVYLLEKTLSVDNLFVFLLLFSELGIPRGQQRRVLSWGIFGALVMRGVCIAVGAAALARWHALVYVLGALLLVTAGKLLFTSGTHASAPSRLLTLLRRWLPLTATLADGRFFVREDGRVRGTPLLLALVAVELTDVVFALDSVPAAFAVTRTPFIVYSANVFALLGLRALYVVLVDALGELRYLRAGLAAVLALAGAKMIASRWVRVPPLLSVAAIAACIAVAVVASLVRRRLDRRRPPRRPWAAPAAPPHTAASRPPST